MQIKSRKIGLKNFIPLIWRLPWMSKSPRNVFFALTVRFPVFNTTWSIISLTSLPFQFFTLRWPTCSTRSVSMPFRYLIVPDTFYKKENQFMFYASWHFLTRTCSVDFSIDPCKNSFKSTGPRWLSETLSLSMIMSDRSETLPVTTCGRSFLKVLKITRGGKCSKRIICWVRKFNYLLERNSSKMRIISRRLI